MNGRNISRIICSIAAAVAVTASFSVSAFADSFVDPAIAYYQREQTTTTAAAVTESDIVEEKVDTAEETAVTTTAVTTAAESESSSSEGTATEITIYNCKYELTVGESFKLSYRLKPSSSKDKVKFTTSSKKVISIASDGTVTAVGEGTAVVTVTAASGVKDKITIKVTAAEDTSSDSETPVEAGDTVSDEDTASNSDETDAAQESTSAASTTSSSGSIGATEIELKHSAVTLVAGETYQIRYSLTPSNSTDTITYRSVSKSIATVSSDGLVTAVGEGNTRIVCKTTSGASIKLNVTVISFSSVDEEIQAEEENVVEEYDDNGVLKASSIVLDDESISLQIGDTHKITGRVFPGAATFTVSYSSSDTSVATVTKGGTIKGVSEGNCIITASTDNGKTDQIYVTVYGSVIKGIDVSKWNGNINWKAVKSSGTVSFAIIRASYGYEDTDPMLAANVEGCEEYNIPYGFYHYTYAKSVSEAKKEARYFLNAIKDYSPTYPVVLDIEESFYKEMSKSEVTEIVKAFMEELEDAGYYAMIYSYAKFFSDCVYMDELSDYDVWVACWGDRDKLDENYSYHYGIWQYSETGTVKGIPEDVDLNYCYKDYASVIRKYGLNGTGN